MTAHQPDEIDRELIRRYRNASGAEPSAPSDSVRAAILAESRRIAALNADLAQPRSSASSHPAAGARRWPYAVFGSLSAAALAAFLILPRFTAGPSRPAPAVDATPAPYVVVPAPSNLDHASDMPPPAAAPAPIPQSATPAAPAPAAPAPAPLAPAALAPAARAEQAFRSNEARLKKDGSAASAGLSAKASVAADGPRRTLDAAVASGDLAGVEALLDQGAAVDDADDQGTRPLLLATVHGRSEIVRLLLERGADPNAADRAGRTALAEAKRLRFKEIETLLIQAGAQETGEPGIASPSR